MRGSRPTTGAAGPHPGPTRPPRRPAAAPGDAPHLSSADGEILGLFRDDPAGAPVASTASRARTPSTDRPLLAAAARAPAAEARDRLWRFAVATSLAARRLADSAGDADPDSSPGPPCCTRSPLGPRRRRPRPARPTGCDADPADRPTLERRWFGRDAAGFGHRLARQLGMRSAVIDAALLADGPRPIPHGRGRRPRRLDLIRRARALADADPLGPLRAGALDRPPDPGRDGWSPPSRPPLVGGLDAPLGPIEPDGTCSGRSSRGSAVDDDRRPGRPRPPARRGDRRPSSHFRSERTPTPGRRRSSTRWPSSPPGPPTS